MTYDDPFTPADTGAAARRRVGTLARSSLALALLGALLSLAGFSGGGTGTMVAGAVTDAVAVAIAAACIRHGMRHEHERGRGFATATVLLACTALVPLGVAAYWGIRGWM